MSEELEQNNDGTWSGLKKTIIGVATTAVMGLGTWGVTQITQAAGGGTTKIIEREKVVEKPVAKPEKKKEGDEFKEEAPKW
jgi:hypothetical protein